MGNLVDYVRHFGTFGSKSLTALPSAHELGPKLSWILRASFLPLVDHEVVPLAYVLFEFAKNQETAVRHPLRLGVIITASSYYNDTGIYKVTLVLRLNDIVEVEVQATAVVDAKDLRV